ncbi:class I SAM-dependent methyltransferase [uncultured Megasphaera sp.]|uniref:class I SAM-dependent methyltransferase n=1 Tax=uncultured Megasphaera sp. TaxID=165188 RepID=UPI00265886F5|nr:class I SAM-dependent methyltransferase [uncultured Megasphaera sp.]
MTGRSIYVTPALKARQQRCEDVRRWAEEIGAVYVPRQGRTVKALEEAYGENFLVYSSRGPQIVRPEGVHFFSLNMAELRIQHLRKGAADHFLEAIGAGDKPIRFLDCTCGFGADSIVASFALPQGSVLDALEVSPLMEAVTAWGFRYFQHSKDDVTAALRRIHLMLGDYRDYLRDSRTPSYDVIYFDPMFSHPVAASCQFQPVRSLMNHSELTADAVYLALQKGRRVVIKERDFTRLKRDFPHLKQYGGTYSRIGYAVIESEES